MKRFVYLLLFFFTFCTQQRNALKDEELNFFNEMIKSEFALKNNLRALFSQSEKHLRTDTVYVIPDSLMEQIAISWQKFKNSFEKFDSMGQYFNSTSPLIPVLELYKNEKYPNYSTLMEKLKPKRVDIVIFKNIVHKYFLIDSLSRKCVLQINC